MKGIYQYKVTYRPRKNPVNPSDYMSRYAVERIPPNLKDNVFVKEAEQYVTFIENYVLPKAKLTEEVKKVTLEDDTLQKMIEKCP
ncbi:hypothetical protein LSH36_2929g00001 [Paralvinella palmiformis]|uniref:Uncharacterized protein n=1 Tax=Paralvinella palmiformis TaxID=53620 RepID=A0AAD9IR35_9ANNE|nr:hypothetical protein LSH36_2929g00001 [Paralvinella palmiformis]